MFNHVVKFGPVVSAYMQSDDPIRHIMGPWRSGKSVGSIMEIVRRSARQKRGPDGYRRSRWMVVRNTMRELRDTTIKTWLDWFPSNVGMGHWNNTTATYYIVVDDIRAEVMFRALDRPDDVANLLSLEVTGFYFNEVRQIAQDILEAAQGRMGMYPSQAFGGCSWHGLWADTNPPEEGSYLECMYEKKDPNKGRVAKDNGWKVLKQPPAVIKDERGVWHLNPLAENVENLIPNYYQEAMKDKSEEYIRVNLGCEYGRSKGGQPVHPLFNKRMHVAREPLKVDHHSLVIVSADFGLTPAITLKQQVATGHLNTLDEVALFDTHLEKAIQDHLLPLLVNKYHGCELFVTGDPSGDNRAQGNGESCVDVFRRYRKKGLGRVKLAYSNDPVLRQGATDHFLGKLGPNGVSYYQVDGANCPMLIEALNGKYMRKRAKDGRHMEEVEKNDWSHIGEANEYGDMYYERGGRRKAEITQRDIFARQPVRPNYNMTR